MKSRRRVLIIIVVCGLVGLLVGLAVRQAVFRASEASTAAGSPAPRESLNATFVTTPDQVVQRMVEMAKLSSEDVVYDLGCGDGRIVISAALSSGCRGVGIEIDQELVDKSIENARQQGVAERVTFRKEDVFKVDLSEVDVAMMYLTRWMVNDLVPQFEKMAPGSRILTHDAWIEQVRPQEILLVRTESGQEHLLYLYTTPLQHDPSMEKDKPPDRASQ